VLHNTWAEYKDPIRNTLTSAASGATRYRPFSSAAAASESTSADIGHSAKPAAAMASQVR